jgi:hypothetical protein
VGLIGSSPFTLVGDPATDSLLPTGELTLDGLTGESPAGIGVLESGPIASGNQVGVDVGDVSPSVPVTVCGNSVGLLGDASSSCGTGGTTDPGTEATVSVDIGSGGTGGTNPGTGAGVGVDIGSGGTNPGATPGADPASGGGIGVGVDVSVGGEISTGGIIAPTQPGTTPGRTDSSGTRGSVSTGTSGIPGTLGLTPGAGGGSGGSTTSFAPLRPAVSGSGALPFTGAAGDLLALVAASLLAAGALVVRATRPDTATEGGGNR